MTRYFDEMKSVLERHGGTVEKFIGDAIMAVFGIPIVHEDDALRAVGCRRDACSACRPECRSRTPVGRHHRGPHRHQHRRGSRRRRTRRADPRHWRRRNIAARLEQAAASGEILIGPDTYRLVRDAIKAEPLGALDLKGKGEAVTAYRLEDVEAEAAGLARRMDSPLVGREHELALLDQAWARCLREQTCHLFTVLGGAGVGRSRLIGEFTASLQDWPTVLWGRCLPYGDGITYWPLAEVVRQAAGIAEDDPGGTAIDKIKVLLQSDPDGNMISDRVAQAIGLTDARVGAEELSWGVRRLLEGLARQHPLVLVFDDVHWAEATFLDLTEQLAEWSREAPLLVVALARPELLDRRPGWGGGKLNATNISLEPLKADECEKLIENLAGQAGLPREVEQRVIAAAEGNPLFVEEMVAMLVDEGRLVRDDGRWRAVGDLSQIEVPATVQALLAARLDTLHGNERRVLETAAVIGRTFWRGALTHLLAGELADSLGASLSALVRKELIRPELASFHGEEGFRFRHILIRDAAYQALPKELRADLHERFAAWLVGKLGDRALEYEEILGYHLEQAYSYHSALGQVGADAERLAVRAAEFLSSGGLRAWTRATHRLRQTCLAALSLCSQTVTLVAWPSNQRWVRPFTQQAALRKRGDCWKGRRRRPASPVTRR